MGRIVINETENKQTVILNDTPEGVSGGYFDSTMNWHEFGGRGAIDEMLTKFEYGGIGNSSDTGSYPHKTSKAAQTAQNRIRLVLPVINKEYKFNAKDGYLISGSHISSLAYEYGLVAAGTNNVYFTNINPASPQWVSSFEPISDYCWLAVKKTDDSDFTQSELDNVIGTIIEVEYVD